MQLEPVSGTVHSLAFSSDGRALWCAHSTTIAVRAWPSLELMKLIPIKCQRLVAHPHDPLMIAAVQSSVLALDEKGQTERCIDAQPGIIAIAGHESGNVYTARFAEDRSIWIERVHEGGAEQLTRLLPSRSWWNWAALLPTTKQLILAMNDAPPERFDWADNVHDTLWKWPPNWMERTQRVGPGALRRSWLSVDAAPDESCIVVSDKGARTVLMWLDEIGRVQSIVNFAKQPEILSDDDQRLGRSVVKGPTRGAAHAVHPGREIVATIDIVGRLTINDARSGDVISIVDGLFSGGYRFSAVS